MATSGATTVLLGGTAAYMAPERAQRKKPTHQSDMYSVGVVMLLAFAPNLIKDVESKKLDPLKALRQAQQHVPNGVPVQTLLHASPFARPAAHQLLSIQGGCEYFSKADTELPYYWESQEGLTEITDQSTLASIWQTLEPTRPAEFGFGIDAGKDWTNLGLGDPQMRNVKLTKAWRVQNGAVWRNYMSGVETIAGNISHGPPIDSDELPVHNLQKIAIRDMVDHAAEKGFRPDGGDRARRDVNETFLLHGLPKTTLHKVTALHSVCLPLAKQHSRLVSHQRHLTTPPIIHTLSELHVVVMALDALICALLRCFMRASTNVSPARIVARSLARARTSLRTSKRQTSTLARRTVRGTSSARST